MIFVDSREPERIVEKLKSLGLDVYVKRLEVGDYLIKHSIYEVPVERKDVNDFISSIIDGRLFRQCHLLSSRYPLSILAVIGDIDEAVEERGISRSAVIGAMVSMAIKNAQGQVVPLVFKNEDDFCLALKSIDSRVSQGDLKILPRLKSHENPKIAMLTAIPGIGEKKAEKLLDYFGSIQRIANASIAELKRVDGIGEKKAREIYRFFR
ncbi:MULTISPECIES: ERCC4 domain-containing protein [Archaeoglobus]|jgi:ERCC4-type nuclease|uniref:DNA repair protein, putative n=3 Tax=Archaeoglobus fulgidus TaxID=2234 RepID=O30253_ARCFU|nr:MULTISPECIES: ERCC4 domain-containing protein [Archaeoglobus]AAB91244.1 DNA repair protein, putative [Archaeoglobus fulgidus DSM 4304]AIG99385.1 ERCC4-type nuclease [Archaeoglobus fulgidus DSM 8774]KUJ94785.1 MAG: DNA repair protein [Archaeoglobus fulgidus]KUK07224.1 MAG: DNA repair protein, putative [Archaeoglobus fulgidus]MDI3498887.1 excision repair protein [Archaeoglobus sp.]